MNPAARLSVALLVGLVLWFPTLGASMRGDVDLPDAAVRYLVAFLFARLAVGGIARLLDAYASDDHEEPTVPKDSTGDDAAARRASDLPTPAGAS